MKGIWLEIVERMISANFTYLGVHGIWDWEFLENAWDTIHIMFAARLPSVMSIFHGEFQNVCTNSPGIIYNAVLRTYSTTAFRALLYQCAISE
jgi:hypothetical protein